MAATCAIHETIGLAFDFDLTLAPGSVDTLLQVLEIDREYWTGKAHMKSIYARVGVRHQAELARVLFEAIRIYAAARAG